MAETSLESFLAAFTPEVRELALRAREIVLGILPPGAVEKVYPGLKVVGYGVGTAMDEMVYGVGPLKAGLRIALMRGVDLPDPHGLLEGTSKTGRQIKITSRDQLDSEPVRRMLEAAWEWKKAAPAPERPAKGKARKAATSADASAAAATANAPPVGDEAVKAATGKTWPEWFAILDAEGAAEKAHGEIASILAERHEVGPWWQQMVAVGYERARGLRQKHETPEGYQVGASKTVNVPLPRLWQAWNDEGLLAKWMPHPFTVRKATENKSMRVTWPDDTRVEVLFYAKGDAKSQVTIDHRRLAGSDAVERARAMWKERLDALKVLLEG
jgi:hypothetical protein